MREILFRGIVTSDFEWEDIEGERFRKGDFAYGQLVFNKGEYYIVGELIEATDEYIAPEYWIPVDPETIGRFTGLRGTAHSKEFPDGEMIFAGDILKYDCYDLGDRMWYERIIEVKDTIRDLYHLEQEMHNSNLSKCFGVIGSVYKPPELLEVSS